MRTTKLHVNLDLHILLNTKDLSKLNKELRNRGIGAITETIDSIAEYETYIISYATNKSFSDIQINNMLSKIDFLLKLQSKGLIEIVSADIEGLLVSADYENDRVVDYKQLWKKQLWKKQLWKKQSSSSLLNKFKQEINEEIKKNRKIIKK